MFGKSWNPATALRALALGSVLMLSQAALAQTPPAAPTLSGEPEFCKWNINLSWTAPNGTDTYQLYKTTGPSTVTPAPTSYGLYKTYPATTTSAFDNSTVAYTSYRIFYRIKACSNTAGCGAFSNAVSVAYTSPCQ